MDMPKKQTYGKPNQYKTKLEKAKTTQPRGEVLVVAKGFALGGFLVFCWLVKNY